MQFPRELDIWVRKLIIGPAVYMQTIPLSRQSEAGVRIITRKARRTNRLAELSALLEAKIGDKKQL